eukprot:PRCOL_00006250-RA
MYCQPSTSDSMSASSRPSLKYLRPQCHASSCLLWWLKQSLEAFAGTLDALGAKLVIRRSAEMLAALLEVCEESSAKPVNINHLFDPVSLVRDKHTYNADLQFERWNVLAWLTPAPRLADHDGESVGELGLEEPAEASSNPLLPQRRTPGEESAMKRFMQFIGAESHLGKMDRAKLQRVVDDGDTPSTSCLSAFLYYGEISALDVWQGLPLPVHARELAPGELARAPLVPRPEPLQDVAAGAYGLPDRRRRSACPMYIQGPR